MSNRSIDSRQTAGKSREHSARCVNTSKTSMEHATAVVDDVPAKTENRPQEPSRPNHVENQKIIPKATLDDAEHVSIVEPSVARPPVVAPKGTTTLSNNWTTPQNHCSCGDSTVFCATQPGHLSLHTNRRVHKNPKNCTCESPRSAAQCALCVPRSVCSWNVHHSIDELNEGPKTAGAYAACSQGHPQPRGGQYFHPALAWRLNLTGSERALHPTVPDCRREPQER